MAEALNGGESETSGIENPTINNKAEEKVFQASEEKTKGNQFFEQKEFKKAIACYHRALMFVKGVEVDGQPNLIQTLCSPFGADAAHTNKLDPIILQKNLKLKMDCYNNLSACLLLSDQPNYEKIVMYCKNAIDISPENKKAHFRMAQALFKLCDYDGALGALQALQKDRNETDSTVMNLKILCQTELAKQTQQHKVMYGKMFGFDNQVAQ